MLWARPLKMTGIPAALYIEDRWQPGRNNEAYDPLRSGQGHVHLCGDDQDWNSAQVLQDYLADGRTITQNL